MADAPIQSSQQYRVPGLATRNLSVVVTGIVAIVALFRAKQEDIPKIVEILVGSKTFAIVGWALAIIFLLVGAILITLLIFNNDREIKRLTKERDDLQTRLLDK